MTEKNTELPQNSQPNQASPSRPANAPATGTSAGQASSATTPATSPLTGTSDTGVKSSGTPKTDARGETAKPAASRTDTADTAKGSRGGAAGGAPPRATAATKKRGMAGPALLILLVIVIVMAVALWFQQRQFKSVASDLQQQAGASATAAQKAGEQAHQALAQAERQASQIADLKAELESSRTEVEGLQRAFQLITDSGSELVLLNDIDHLVTIAQQQLQLGGNVANAIISLETAQAQLARANRPGLASLQQTINGDLGKLRAASTIDVALLSSQLEEFGNLVSHAPLIMPDDAAPRPVEPTASQDTAPSQATQPGSEDAPWWRQALQRANTWSRETWDDLAQDLGTFINVRRVDDASALLMSPDQATRFRENLRLRIMTAQLALMMRQPGIWKSETEALMQAVERRYDPNSQQTRQALKLARQFADTSIDVHLPTVQNSLQAIEALREERERGAAAQGLPGDSGQGEDAGQSPAGNGARQDGTASPGNPQEHLGSHEDDGASQEGDVQDAIPSRQEQSDPSGQSPGQDTQTQENKAPTTVDPGQNHGGMSSATARFSLNQS